MSVNSERNLIGLAMFGVVIAIAYYQFFKGTGPLEPAKAEKLLDFALQVEVNRIEVIIPDGEVARAPSSTLQSVKALDCPTLTRSYGSVPGRYDSGGMHYGSATFECLFIGESPSGERLFFSAYVYRTADPSGKGYNNGHSMSFQESEKTLLLMAKLDQKIDTITRQQQSELWSSLANDDIFVPADKTQVSPMKKALDAHIDRIRSK